MATTVAVVGPGTSTGHGPEWTTLQRASDRSVLRAVLDKLLFFKNAAKEVLIPSIRCSDAGCDSPKSLN